MLILTHVFWTGASSIWELQFPFNNIAHVGNGTLSPNALAFFSSITSLLFAADGDDYDGAAMEYPWLASMKWLSLQDLYVKAHNDKGIASANDILVASPSVQHLVLHICHQSSSYLFRNLILILFTVYVRVDQGIKVDFSCMNSMKNLALTVDLSGIQMIAGSLSTLKGRVLRKVTINVYAAWNDMDNQDWSVIGQLDSALTRLIDPERFHGMVIGSYMIDDKYDKSRSWWCIENCFPIMRGAYGMKVCVEETLCMQARNATASKTLITPTPNTTHTNPQSSWGDIMR